MKEEFWKLFTQAVVLQENALNNGPGVSEKENSALQRARFASAQGVEYIFAGYLRAVNDVFTPEQQDRHRKHHSGTKRPGRFYAAANFWIQPVTSETPTEPKLLQSNFYTKEETTETTQQYVWAALAQVSPQTPLNRDLSQLQILRL